MIKKYVPIALLFFITFSCSDPNGEVAPDPTNTSNNSNNNNNNQSPSNEADINGLLNLINQARSAGSVCRGNALPSVPAYSLNDELTAAALRHCLDMKNNIRSLSHTGSDGSSAGDRIEDEGYNWRAWGENIAGGQPDEQTVFAAWMASNSGHCEAIMSDRFTEIGIARAGNYWTLVFAQPR